MIRYPVERIEYCKTVGRTRVENIAEILRSLRGFEVVVREPEAYDVDVWVSKDNQLVLVIEVLNWRKNIYMDFKRTMAIRENLSNPIYRDLGKLLVFSFWKNVENQMGFFDSLGIDFLEIGFQTQPVRYYVWFLGRGLDGGMKPNFRATKEIVKDKLLAYLRKKNLI